jgi:hypothetical protein
MGARHHGSTADASQGGRCITPIAFEYAGGCHVGRRMKKSLHRLVLALLLPALASCTTAYDAQGRPRQVVDPGAALIGAAVVGLIAYGIASSNNSDRHHRQGSCSSGNGYRSRRGYGYY